MLEASYPPSTTYSMFLKTLREAKPWKEMFLLEMKGESGDTFFQNIFHFNIFDTSLGIFARFGSDTDAARWQLRRWWNPKLSLCLGGSPLNDFHIGSNLYFQLEGLPRPTDDLMRVMISMGLVNLSKLPKLESA